jgi:hypothetical protein
VPLARYVVFVGSSLLALLFLADWYWPTNVGAVSFRDPQVDKSIIRLHSAQRWPERIVLDTSQPTIVPPAQQTASNDIPPKPLDAQAQMHVLPPKQAAASVKSKRRVARRVQRTGSRNSGRAARGVFPGLVTVAALSDEECASRRCSDA